MNQRKQFSVVAVALAMALSAPTVFAAGGSQDALKAQARGHGEGARATGLAKIPGGAVQSVELENENGKLVWSFDISDPKSPNVIEVQVDAKTGRIVSKKSESPSEQAKEAKADKVLKP